MKTKIVVILFCMLLIGSVIFQVAGAIHGKKIAKIGWEQDPDPNGWDVNATLPMIVADDFICNATETIENFIFWGSWEGDNIDQCGHIPILSVHEDLPVGHSDNPYPYNIPGAMLWYQAVMPSEIEMTESLQGWLDPAYAIWHPDDHQKWYQFNVNVGAAGFPQTSGTHYWFAIKMDVMSSSHWGWKTSLTQNNHCAVWGDPNVLAPNGFDWYEVRDQSGYMLDMSFVLSKRPGIGVSFNDDSSITYGNPPFDITNFGTSVMGVDWILHFEGGFVFSNRISTGSIVLEPKETKTIKSEGNIFGFGPTSIYIDVLIDGKKLESAKTERFLLGSFLLKIS